MTLSMKAILATLSMILSRRSLKATLCCATNRRHVYSLSKPSVQGFILRQVSKANCRKADHIQPTMERLLRYQTPL